MDEFYLSLLSDSSMDIFPKNKQFSFTTKLNHPIQVQKEQWVVALVEIMTPSEVYNISHNSNYFYVHFYDENVLERLGKSKMNTVYMKDGILELQGWTDGMDPDSDPDLSLFIAVMTLVIGVMSLFIGIMTLIRGLVLRLMASLIVHAPQIVYITCMWSELK